jgi:hypothetical protein
MCPPKQSGGNQQATNTAFLEFGLGAVTDLFGYSQERKEVKRYNDALKADFRRREAKYLNDFNRAEVLWRDEATNRQIDVDDKWKQVMVEGARQQVELWNTVKKAGNANAAAYAELMSKGGASEQAGARSRSSVNRRNAVLAYAQKVNQTAALVSLPRDQAALRIDALNDQMSSYIKAQDIAIGTSKPVPGEPPILAGHQFKQQPSFMSTLLNIGKRGLDARKTYLNLKPPKTYDTQPTTPETPTTPNIEWDTPTESPSPFIPPEGFPTFGSGQVEDFYGKSMDIAKRNQASSALAQSIFNTFKV